MFNWTTIVVKTKKLKLYVFSPAFRLDGHKIGCNLKTVLVIHQLLNAQGLVLPAWD